MNALRSLLLCHNLPLDISTNIRLSSQRLRKLSDQTIVFVSHMGAMVRNLCNRAVWIEGGVTRMDGDSSEVVAAYEEYMFKMSKQ